MGGKTKQSQRTKNNVRPSSSGRSALLLSNVNVDSKVGFGGSDLPALFPTLVVPSIDPNVPHELQLCFKKLNKKDPITKTKALQELNELVTSSNVEDVVAALPSWAHCYKMLTADPDRKVREATQLCHGTIVSVSGRRVAPHLKQLVPSWLQAQHDDHAPAHTLACASLTKTFPDSKLPEVISFCKEEVMTHFIDNLLGPGETAYIRKTDSSEQAEATRARVCLGSLRGLLWVCARLPASQHAWLLARLHPLLAHKELWLRAQHYTDHVRAAWYACMGGIAQRFGAQFAERYGQKMLRVMLAAKESSPFVVAHLWDALLLFIYHVEDWHKYLDKEDLFKKRIFDLLENGGWGDARHLGNLALPLLARLPAHLATTDFYLQYFRAMFQGLETKSVLASKSERQAWLTCVDECLRYVSRLETPATEVVPAVLRLWLDAALDAGRERPLRTQLVQRSGAQLAALALYWLRRGHPCDTLVTHFWLQLRAVTAAQLEQLEQHQPDTRTVVEGHVLLLLTLHDSFGTERRRPAIKFHDEEPPPEPPAAEESECEPVIRERYESSLRAAVWEQCGRSLVLAARQLAVEPVLAPLVPLLRRYNSAALFVHVARQFSCDSVYGWYERVLQRWLADEAVCGACVVDVVALLLHHLSEPERQQLFDTFDRFPPCAVEWCVRACVSDACSGAARWLRGPTVHSCVRTLLARTLRTGDDVAADLLRLCLRTDHTGEVLVSTEAAQEVVTQLCALCEQHAGPQETQDDDAAQEKAAAAQQSALDTCAALCSELCGAPPYDAATDVLVAALFNLALTTPSACAALAAQTRAACVASLHAALAALEPRRRDRLLHRAAGAVHRLLQAQSGVVESSQLEHIVSVCCETLCSELCPESFVEVVARLGGAAPCQLELRALRHELLAGRLSCPLLDGDVTQAAADTDDELSARTVLQLGNARLFRAAGTRALTSSDVTAAHVSRLCAVLYDAAVLRSLARAYAFWEHYPIIEEIKTRIETIVEAAVERCSETSRQAVSDELARLALDHGYYWAFAGNYYRDVLRASESTDTHHGDTHHGDTHDGDTHDGNTHDGDTHDGDTHDGDTHDGDTHDEGTRNGDESHDTHVDGAPLDVDNIDDIVTRNGFFHILQVNAAELPEGDNLRVTYLTMLRALYLGYKHEPAVVGPRFLADVARGQRDNDADVIVHAYYAANHVMLYDTELRGVSWGAASCCAGVLRYLAALVAARGWQLCAAHWDFVTISLCSLLASVRRSAAHCDDVRVALLARAALHLYVTVHDFVDNVRARSLREQPSEHVAQLPHEWADVFAPDAHHSIFSLLVHMLESGVESAMSGGRVCVTAGLLECGARLQWSRLAAEQRAALSARRVQRAACAALQHASHAASVLLAYSALHAVLEPLVLQDEELVAELKEGEERPRLSLHEYRDTFEGLREYVQDALQHVTVCEEWCALQGSSAGGVRALAWLLLARVLAAHCSRAEHRLALHYADIYRELQYCESVLECALRLLPADVFAWAQDGGQAPAVPPRDHLFHDEPARDLLRPPGTELVAAAACGAVTACVCGGGAADARGWAGARAHRHARVLPALVRAYVAPRVTRRELEALQRAPPAQATVRVRAGPPAEVTCALAVEERVLELRVRVSGEHPLEAPRARVLLGGRGADAAWLRLYAQYRGCALPAALRLWAAAVTARVQAAPHCYICYSRLHFESGCLPQVCCHQCRNRFHTACLREWFKTSNKPNCPLCRTPF